MIERFDPHLQILPPAQRGLWETLRPLSELGFVLYGGTAIALRLGHRQSVDFDFFTERPLDRPCLLGHLALLRSATVLQDQPDTLTVLVTEAERPVKVSFFGSIGFGRVGVPARSRDGVLSVASIDDLLATKLKVLLQRIEPRDYIDIASLLGHAAKLPVGLAAARALFGTAFQPSEALKALVYFEPRELEGLGTEARALLVAHATSVRDLPSVTIRSSRLSAD